MTVNEAEVRTAIKVLYVQTLDAPPESEWKGNDGTISFISSTLGVHRGTVHDVLLRCTAAEENKMNVDVSERFSNGPGMHNTRINLGSAEADMLVGCMCKGWVHRAVCSTSHRKMDGSDGFKFYFGTPAQAWETMFKCWCHNGQGAVNRR